MNRPVSTSKPANFELISCVLLTLAVQLFILLFHHGTGDDGDSIGHFLYAKYAFKYPHFIIHQWAKPVYILTASLFAQFGFVGIKVYNMVVGLLSGYTVYLICKQLNFRNAWMCIPFLAFMPQYFLLTFSGLTEPIFALNVTFASYLLIKEKPFWAVVLISFSPFARPEGLFFIAIFFAYLLFYKKWWKHIPWLLLGHVVITLLGLIFFGEKSPLWIFQKNPNAAIDPAYGQTGDWWHYLIGLKHTLGWPLYYLLWFGFIAGAVSFFRGKMKQVLKYALIFAGFLSVVISHTIFWKYGLFKSFGLWRVLLCVCPLAAIICLMGYNSIIQLLHVPTKWRIYLRYLVVLIVLVYPFSNDEFTFQYPRDFGLSPQQEMAEEVAIYLKENYPSSLYYHFYPSMSHILKMDHFDWRKRQELNANIKDYDLPKQSVVIWDEWYAVMEGKVPLEMLESHPQLKHLKSFSTKDKWGKKRELILFVEHLKK